MRFLAFAGAVALIAVAATTPARAGDYYDDGYYGGGYRHAGYYDASYRRYSDDGYYRRRYYDDYRPRRDYRSTCCYRRVSYDQRAGYYGGYDRPYRSGYYDNY
jgi:hypothetical protein